MTPLPIAPPVDVVARGVTVHRGRRLALDDVTLGLAPGQVVAVIGPNGSGKSTLLHAIAGLLDPTAGELLVGGEPAAAGSGRVSYVLQGTDVSEHLPITVREVVRMGRYSRRGPLRRLSTDDHEIVDAAMERLAVADLADRQVRELSGGQRQRVFVAQGLAQQAPVLLLDEPVTGLDVVSQRTILEVIGAERDAGRLVVVTTHDLGEAAHADHVVLLSRRLVAEGPPTEVLVAEHLADAYGQRLVHLGDGALMLDDSPHHEPDGGDVHAHPGHRH